MKIPLTVIGKIRKTHGLKGELRVFIDEKYLEDFIQTQALYIGNIDRAIPFFVEKQRALPQPIIKLEEIDNKEEADALGKANISIPTADLIPDAERTLILEDDNPDFSGYSVIQSESETTVAHIIRVDEYPQQLMLVVEVFGKEGQEKLIPYHQSLVLATDELEKTITIAIPDGLLDL